MSVFAWCEDTKSGFEFWKKIFGYINPDIVVESKRNCTELLKAVCSIGSTTDYYLILLDSGGNIVQRLATMLKRAMNRNKHIILIDIYSFEYVLLSFEKLEDWVYAEEDEFRIKRANLLKIRREVLQLVSSGIERDGLEVLKKFDKFKSCSTLEEYIARLLFEITRNTGFETRKNKLGECFYVSCCEWLNREDNDICGLDNMRISGSEKLQSIVDYSVLKTAYRGGSLSNVNYL